MSADTIGFVKGGMNEEINELKTKTLADIMKEEMERKKKFR